MQQNKIEIKSGGAKICSSEFLGYYIIKCLKSIIDDLKCGFRSVLTARWLLRFGQHLSFFQDGYKNS